MADKAKKIFKSGGEKPTATENEVAQALLELEQTSKDLAADLKDIHITAAKKLPMVTKNPMLFSILIVNEENSSEFNPALFENWKRNSVGNMLFS